MEKKVSRDDTEDDTGKEEDNDYEVEEARESLDMSLGKRLTMFIQGLSSTSNVMKLSSVERLPLGRFYITIKDRRYRGWWCFMVIAASYSSMFTPVEFGFFRGLPRALWIIDFSIQLIFLADIVIRFFTAYRDRDTFRLVVKHRDIALRYLKSDFILDFLGCLPWDTFYKVFGRKEEVRALVWVRLYRVRKVDAFFDALEKDIRINYFAARIMKLLAVEFYCTHTAACLYYYLATTVKASKEDYTWIGSLTLGSFSYTEFRAIDLGKRYVTSLYWAILTMATVGYGDVHAVNVREMIFVMIYVSFDMILGAYLIGNMTALIVKGSGTEKFRDRMTSLVKFMNRNGLPRDIRTQMKNHVRLQFESGTMTEDTTVLEHLPVSMRSKVAYSLYSHIVEQVPIFKGCSSQFLNEIVSKVTEEHFLPGEVVIQQGGASDQFYIVCHGVLEEVLVNENGEEELVEVHHAESTFGEVGVLCNIPQPFSVRVIELSRVLRLDKHSFSDILQIYFNDGRLLINNLLEWKHADARVGQLAADVTFLVAKQAAEMALMVNNASYQGDLAQLKHLVKEGAIVARPDYDGRTPLHLAASKGFEAVIIYLIREGADVNAIDKFGRTPLLEAVKGGHDNCMSVLVDHGAELHLQDSGSVLCQAVKNGNGELLRRFLVAGVNVSASDYDRRTPLHLASSEGSYGLAKMLVEAGADIFARDRWGRTPLDEAILHNNEPIAAFLKEAAQQPRNQVKPAPALHEVTSAWRSRRSSHPSKESGDSETKVDKEVMDDRKGPGSMIVASSLPSMDSLPGTPRTGHISATQHQSSSEKSRLDKILSLVAPRHSNGMEYENLSHQYRMLPTRQVSRRTFTEQPLPSPSLSRRRVTIFPYHPWSPIKARTIGKVDWVPPTIEEVLELASLYFGKEGSKVLNEDAGEISSTDFIMDSDKIYVVDENDLLNAGSSDW